MPERYTSEEFEELCDVHMKRIVNLGERVAANVGALDEDLPDVIQEALIVVHQHIVGDRLDKRDHDTLGNEIFVVRDCLAVYFPRAFFRTTVEHRVLDRHKARKRRKKWFGQPMPMSSVEERFLDEMDDPHLTKTELSGRIARLCGTCRELIKLRFFDGLTYQEICDVLSSEFRNEAAVRRKTADCLKKLR